MATERNTIQRKLVLEAVNTLKCHATADEIFEFIHQKYPDVSKATVYRNLAKLSDSGEIRRTQLPNDVARYDHLCFNHYHAKCVKCGKIFDVEMEYISNLEQNVKDAHGLQFVGHDIVFSCICPHCQK